MPGLLASLNSAALSLRAYERALATVQNNVANASTPGYARQQVDLVARAFQPELELPGGVTVSDLVSTRDEHAERLVRRQASLHGRSSQMVTTLPRLEAVLDIRDGSGIAGALDRLFSSFGRLAVTPNDLGAREDVLGRAREVAQAFRWTASALLEARQETHREVRSAVERVNRLAHTIRDINAEIRSDRRKLSDAGLDARLNAALEELAEWVEFQALRADDGSVTVLVGGQTLLVIGERVLELQADLSGPTAELLDAYGTVVTSHVRQGRLAGLLETGNNVIPSLVASLDLLAQTFADRVNSILASGVDRNGQPPLVNLFTYSAATGAAYTLAVTAITASELAAAYASAPGGNGNALELAALATSAEIQGLSFTAFYGSIAAEAGRALASARQGAALQGALLAQARSLRETASGVNLDEEAAAMIQYQRAYQAAAKLVTVLDELIETVLRMVR